MNLLAALLTLVPVLSPELLIPPDQRALASELARLETFMPASALSALVAGPEDEVAGYVLGDTRFLGTRNGEFGRSWIERELTARAVGKTDVPWAVLFAIRRRHRGEPVGLDIVAAAARGPHARPRTSADRLEILDLVRFDKNAAAPSAGQEALLDAIAATLVGNPELRLLELRGHAEPGERGAEALARRRAAAVRDELVRRGVDGERLAPAGEVVRAPGAQRSKDATRYVELFNIRAGRRPASAATTAGHQDARDERQHRRE